MRIEKASGFGNGVTELSDNLRSLNIQAAATALKKRSLML